MGRWIDRYHGTSLKKRLLFSILFASLIPFFIIVVLSYNTISGILDSAVIDAMQSSDLQLESTLSDTIRSINHVSQMLAFNEGVNANIDAFFNNPEPYRRPEIVDKINNDLNLIAFTNPDVKLAFFYLPDEGSVYFENFAVREGFGLESLPLFAPYFGINYYGPHLSWNRFEKVLVLSAVRQVSLSYPRDVLVYIEAEYKLDRIVGELGTEENRYHHLILDGDGLVVYSDTDAYVRGTAFTVANRADRGYERDNYWFRTTSNQGWSVVLLVPAGEYIRERREWMGKMGMILCAVIALSIGTALFLRRLIYRPIHQFHLEFGEISNGNFAFRSSLMKIPEFDELFEGFQDMKSEILRLMDRIKVDEKERSDLEIEKLRSQINPHFLLNSLNTVHWLAIMKNQDDIDEVVQSLVKLLSYNLDSKHPDAPIEEEIAALQSYLLLQSKRYDLHYEFSLPDDPRFRELRIPRFILQPVVENAIFHGLGDDGYLGVFFEMGDTLVISVKDNGKGMEQEELMRYFGGYDILSRKSIGMGIGLNFVQKTLKRFYGERGRLTGESLPGEGTVITVEIPLDREEGDD